MDSPIPSPHDGFLQFCVPVLHALSESDSPWSFEAGRSERALLATTDEDSAEWLWRMAELHRDRGRFSSSLNYAALAIDVSERANSPLDLVCAHAVATSVHVMKGNFTTARDTLTKVRPLTIENSDQRISAVYNETLATLLLRAVGSTFFEFEEAGERYTLAGNIYRELNDIPGQIRCSVGMSSVLSGRGQYFRAVEQVDEGLRISLEHLNWSYLGQLLGCAAFAFRDQGYRHCVPDLFALSVEWSTYVGDIPARIRSVSGIGELAKMDFTPPAQEALDRAIAQICQAIWEAKEIGAGPMMLEMQMALAGLFKKAGDPESQWKCRVIAEEIAQSEAFEGAHRVINWNDFIADRLIVAREERIASRLEEALEGSADPFFVFDPRHGSDSTRFDLLNEFRNSAADRLLGIDDRSVRLLPDLAEVPEFVGLQIPLMRAAIDRESFEDEIRVFGLKGDAVWYARRVAPAGAGAVLTFRDVTTTHRIEDALREAADRANEADRAKSEFLANMSHEVRTPINGVLGLAQLLRALDLDPVARKYVDGIVSSGNILLKVIGDVLDLSKIEARKLQLTVGPVLLRSLVSEVVDLFAGQAASHGVPLAFRMGHEVPEVIETDGSSLRQVLANLIGNSIKFTESGSIEVSVSLQDCFLRFEVRDTGIGIPAHLLETIFEPFQQGGTEMDFGGTGLGLTISRRLIELMGGQMGVSSVEKGGSTFFFTLPLKEAVGSQIEPEPIGKADEVRFEGRQILLVEDNPVNTMVSEGMLTQLGCAVTCVENGQEALDAVEKQSFDMVLMDMRMPVMDGIEATVALRDREKLSGTHLPIVALTAGALTQEREACLEAGMDDYLTKPFTLQALRETMFRNFARATSANS